MAGTVITVAQQKGGAGKTTLVAHLAVALAHAGRSVATMDIDPQGSLSQWQEVRAAFPDLRPIGHSRVTGWRTANEVERLAQRHDVVILDSPPHAETEARIAVRAARLVLIPAQPSPMDLWATRPTLDIAKAEGTAALIVLNRVPSRARLAEILTPKLGDLGADVARAGIGNRVAFAAALMDGRGVTESEPSSRAAAEIKALSKEILSRLKRLGA
ncbi:MAG: ParA family partition ATPase [Inquilinaceae bacterium]